MRGGEDKPSLADISQAHDSLVVGDHEFAVRVDLGHDRPAIKHPVLHQLVEPDIFLTSKKKTKKRRDGSESKKTVR